MKSLALQTSSFLLWGVLASSHAAQNTKLSQPFPPGLASGDVTRFLTSSDGSRVVYLANQDSTEALELYSRATDGSGSPVRLSLPLIEGAHISWFTVTPPGDRVLYEAHAYVGTTAHVALYSVPIDGSATAVRIDDSSSSNEDVSSFQSAPDGSRVVYLQGPTSTSSTNTYRLFTAPTDGSVDAFSIAEGWNVRGPLIDPTGTLVVYAALDESLLFENLHSVPLDGSTSPVLLSDSIPVRGRFFIAPDGKRAVYYADHSLVSVPMDGSAAPTILSGAIEVNDTGFMLQELAFSADGTRVLFNGLDLNDLSLNVYSAPIAGGGGPVELGGAIYTVSPVSPFVVFQGGGAQLFRRAIDGSDAPLPLAAPGGQVFSLEIGATEHVVWMSRTNNLLRLFSVPLDGSVPARRLDSSGNPASEVSDFRLSPDGASVAFVADLETDNQRELYRVPTAGGAAPTKLNPPLVPGGEVSGPQSPDFAFSPDGLHVLYRADQEAPDVVELFRTRADGSGGDLKLNGPLALLPLGDVLDVQTTGDGTWAVYRASTGLFAVPTDGSAPAVQLQGTPATASHVEAYGLAPGGGRVAFIAGSWQSTAAELYAAPLDGSAPPVRLDGGLVAGGDVVALRMSPDGERVVFLADKQTDQVFELFVVPLDGSAQPLKLNGTLVPGGNVGFLNARFEVSADGPRLVYIADQLVLGRRDLFSVPLDGSAPSIRLGTKPAYDFRLSPDGSRVVFLRWDSYVGGSDRGDLFTAPADGSGPALRLNPVGSGSRVSRFSVGPTHVAFAADFTAGKWQVYGVPSDASAAPVPLYDPLPPEANTYGTHVHLALSPDGMRVAFTLAPEGVLELFSAPLDGSTPARKLNHALPTNAHVADYEPPRVSPDGRHVLYRTEENLGRLSLHVAPLRGGAPAIRLDPSVLPPSVTAAAFAPDGFSVLFLSSYTTLHRLELLRVPVWGGAPVILSSLESPRSDVSSFGVVPAGPRVLFIADQDTNEVFELFATPLPRWKTRRAP